LKELSAIMPTVFCVNHEIILDKVKERYRLVQILSDRLKTIRRC